MKMMLVAMALVTALPAQAQTLSGPAEVVDGDSLSVAGLSVRLFGIDAPEGKQTCTRSGEIWRCGKEAASRLRGLIGSGRVDCRGRGMDTYGRTLATCAVSGVELNRAMVEAGWATAFRKYSQDYVREEDQAKAAGRGIWSSQFQQPEEYRAAQAITRSGAPARHAPAYLAAPSRNAAGCTIKGNRNRKGQGIYHLPGMPYYEETRAEELFCSEADARAAGYRRAIVR